MNNTNFLLSSAIMMVLSLTGCNDNNSTPSTLPSPTPGLTSLQSCNDAVDQQGLCLTNKSDAYQWLANEGQKHTQPNYANSLGVQASVEVASDAASDGSSTSDSSGASDGSVENSDQKSNEESSKTNTVEQGVDEADWVKVINNRYILTPKQPEKDIQYTWKELTAKDTEECHADFFTSLPRTNNVDAPDWCQGYWDIEITDSRPAEIKVFEMLANPASAELISAIELNPYANYVNGLYDVLDDSALLVLTSLQQDETSNYYVGPTNKSGINLIDISAPTAPMKKWHITLDGYVLESRVIEQDLYVVSQYYPQYSSQYNDELTAEQLASIPQTQLMGAIQINNGEVKPLANIEQCLLPTQQRSRYNLAFTYLTKVNLNDPTDIETICTLAPVDSVYVSQSALYFINTTSRWLSDDSVSTTSLDRFDLASFSYSTSLTVQGSLGWGIDTAFRVKEQQLDGESVLTLVLTKAGGNEISHQIANYLVSNNTLSLLDSYPSEGEAKIGKTGEDIFSVRIDDASIQIVTYLNTDPLYEFNIADPRNIWMESELEIPGFSTYLHNIDDTELSVGVGNTDNGRLKVELYDQSGTNSVALSNLTLEYGVNSPATYDYKAFTSLNDKESQSFNIALPIHAWYCCDFVSNPSIESAIEPSSEISGTMSGLWLLNVDYSVSPAVLSEIDLVEMSYAHNHLRNARAILKGNIAYYVLDGEVYSVMLTKDAVVHSTLN